MRKVFARFIEDESGATAIEYGLIAGGLATFVFAAASALGPQISATFTAIGAYLATNGSP
ncbi:MAG: Flp family type IVb pilin [Pseudomonadota bacterium]